MRFALFLVSSSPAFERVVPWEMEEEMGVGSDDAPPSERSKNQTENEMKISRDRLLPNNEIPSLLCTMSKNVKDSI